MALRWGDAVDAVPPPASASSYSESLIRETGLEAFLMDLGFGPHEWLGVKIVGVDDREPDFDLIEPGPVPAKTGNTFVGVKWK